MLSRLVSLAVSLSVVLLVASAPAAPTVEFRNDRLTAHMEKVPVADCVRAIEVATGADIRGKIPAEGEVSIDLDAVPLHQALGRIFGESNFSITYRGDGAPAAIELLGGPLAAAVKPAVKPAATPPTPEPRAEGAVWPADEATRQAVLTLQQFLERNPSIELPASLARSLGTKTMPFRDLARTAATSDDRGVRSRAWRLSVRTMREDPAVWEAFRTVITTAPEEGMRDFVRHQLGPRAEELTRELMVRSDPEIRGSARVVLEQLRAEPEPAAGVLGTP